MKMPLALVILLPLSVAAATITPTESSLRAALASETVINFSSSGTIAISQPLEVSRDVAIDGIGQSITIDGQNSTTLFKANSGVRLTLRNLRLANGQSRGTNGQAVSEPGGPAMGGAIQNLGGTVTVADCIFTNNSAVGGDAYFHFNFVIDTGVGGTGHGGAIYQTGGSLSIVTSVFVNNRATGGLGSGNAFAAGGAIFASGGIVTITASTFETNMVFAGPSAGRELPGGEGSGGAIHAQETQLNIEGSKFDGNIARAQHNSPGLGGAVFARNSPALIVDSYFLENKAIGGNGIFWRNHQVAPGQPGRGGAVYIGAGSTANIQSSSFVGNQTHGGADSYSPFPPNGSPSHGGAVYNGSSTAIRNTIFAGNGAFHFLPGAASSGGAIQSAGTLDLAHVTLAENQCNGPIVANASGVANIRASLFGPNRGPSASGSFVDNGFNLSADSTPVFSETTSANNTDPRLGPLGDYGGLTPTIPVLADSPAIDRVTDNVAPEFDQRGRARPYGAHPDSGAFESSAPFYILGRINGRVPAGTTVTHSSTLTPDANNQFTLSAVPAGPITISITGPNTVFHPSPLTLNVQADMIVPFTGFTYHEFAWAPENGVPIYAFAGRLNETWDFHASNDLLEWRRILDHEFIQPAPYHIHLTGVQTPVFLKAVRR